MNLSNKFKMLIIIAFLGLVSACNKSTPVSSSSQTTIPEILSIEADKTQIRALMDFTNITCIAKGGNLSYKWEVDLGDIVPQNSERSIIRFSGASCCEGEKEIKCTVSNDKGSISKTVLVKIIPEVREPNINSFESNTKEIHYSNNQKAELNCFAVGGGNMIYVWSVDCGDFVYSSKDSSKVSYIAKKNCAGSRIISCKVINEKGEDIKYLTLIVLK